VETWNRACERAELKAPLVFICPNLHSQFFFRTRKQKKPFFSMPWQRRDLLRKSWLFRNVDDCLARAIHRHFDRSARWSHFVSNNRAIVEISHVRFHPGPDATPWWVTLSVFPFASPMRCLAIKPKHDVRHPQNGKYVTTYSCRQRTTEPRPQATCTEKLQWLRRAIFDGHVYASEQTDSVRICVMFEYSFVRYFVLQLCCVIGRLSYMYC